MAEEESVDGKLDDRKRLSTTVVTVGDQAAFAALALALCAAAWHVSGLVPLDSILKVIGK